MTYDEQLKHPKWQKKRLEVLEAHNFKCQTCKSEDLTLHVHHKKYERGKLAWEYPIDNFTCLCECCHEAAHENCCDVKLYALVYDCEMHKKIIQPYFPLYCPNCGTPISTQ